MIDAREEAAVDELPGAECSAKIVVLCATQELLIVCQLNVGLRDGDIGRMDILQQGIRWFRRGGHL